VLLALIAAVVIAGTWLAGKRQGVREAQEIASETLASTEALDTIDQLRARLYQSEQDLSKTKMSLEAGNARTLSLQNQLDKHMREQTSDAADLALYRSIETSQKDAAIEVQSLSWSPSEPSMLNLTLIQWKGRDRVKGDVTISLQYAGGVTDVTSVTPTGDDSEGSLKTVNSTVDLEQIFFDFRFFQKLSVQMPLLTSDTGAGKSLIAVPSFVKVVINTADKRLGVADVLIPWSKVEHTIVD